MTFQLKRASTVGAESGDSEALGATSQRVTFGAVSINSDASRNIRVRLSATAIGSSEGGTGSGYVFIVGPFAGVYKFAEGSAPTQISGAFTPALNMNSGTFAVTGSTQTFDADTGLLTLEITIGGTTHVATATDGTPLNGAVMNLTNYVPTPVDYQYFEWIAAPGVPTNPTATNITHNSATLGCTAPTSGGAVVNYEFDVREAGATSFTTHDSATTSYALTGLDGVQPYEYRIRAEGAGALFSAYTAIQTFTTDNGATGGGGSLAGSALLAPALRVSEWTGGDLTIRVRSTFSGAPVVGETITAISSDTSKVSVSLSSITDSQGYASFTLEFVSGGRSVITFAKTGTTKDMLAITRTIQA